MTVLNFMRMSVSYFILVSQAFTEMLSAPSVLRL